MYNLHVGADRGRLYVFLGAAPGAGKTYAMLAEGSRMAATGRDVVVAVVESHGRPATDKRIEGLEVMPLRVISHRDTWFDELDIDGVVARRPQVALVDELAHTNVVGCRHEKRWQDVEELLAAGIDVITNLNVAHLDSLNDVVETITGVAQHETVPDPVVAGAQRIELIDASVEVLQARLADSGGRVAEDAEAAVRGYYRAEKVDALRELARTWMTAHGGAGSGSTASEGVVTKPVRVVAALTGAAEGRHVVRRAAAMASAAGGELIGVHVREPSGLLESRSTWLDEQQRLLAELGGRYTEVAAVDVAQAVLDVCRSEGARHLVLGASRRTRRDEVFHGSVIAQAIRMAGSVEVHLVPSDQPPKGLGVPARSWLPTRHRLPLPRRRRQLAWVLAVLAPALLTVSLIGLRSSVGVAGALFAALLGVVAVAAIGGIWPAALAIVVGFVMADFFFTVPYYSLRVDHLLDLIALVAYAVAGGVVGLLVDVLARQGVQVAGARCVAEGLARLAAESLSVEPAALPGVAGTLRTTFGLDAVAVLTRVGSTWRPEFAVGDPIPERPEETPFTADIGDGRVLVLTAHPGSDRDLQLLRAFVADLRHRREREQLARLG